MTRRDVNHSGWVAIPMNQGGSHVIYVILSIVLFVKILVVKFLTM